MSRAEKFRIFWENACWTCDSEAFTFQCTDELSPLDRFIGQDRAEEALRFGLEVDKPGYNLFVTGLTGTGKTSAIKAHLQSIVLDLNGKDQRKAINDWIYVYNFEDTDRPLPLRLSPGAGKALRHRMSEMLRMLGDDIPKVFKSEEYETQRRNLEETDRQQTRQLMTELEETARNSNFAVQVAPTGVTIFPMLDDRPMNPEEYHALEAEAKTAIDETRNQLMQQTQEVMSSIREIEKGTSERVRDLDRATAGERISDIFQALLDSYQDVPDLNPNPPKDGV